MSFAKCLDIERESKRLLIPFVAAQHGTRPVEIPHDYDSQTMGDWRITRRDGYEFNVELKAEVDDTGNLFLETLSNWHTTRYGWFLTSRAEQLWYHFLDTKCLYTVPLGLLRWWAWGAEDDIDSGHIDKYREVSQQKYGQPNLTKGFLVPVRILQREVEKFETFMINGY